MLQGVVWIDEAYVSVSPDNIIRINNKKLRGISINQIAVACAVDNLGRSYAKVTGRGHLSAAKVFLLRYHYGYLMSMIIFGNNLCLLIIGKYMLITEGHIRNLMNGKKGNQLSNVFIILNYGD